MKVKFLPMDVELEITSDQSVMSLAHENDIPIMVFNLFEKGNIVRAVKGEPVGTIVGGSCAVK